ncbi:MAG: PAS domain S-box protein [Bacteroidetes bacterium]|nr:PAS domain S-box protein [Bacteroidota bacterium]
MHLILTLTALTVFWFADSVTDFFLYHYSSLPLSFFPENLHEWVMRILVVLAISGYSLVIWLKGKATAENIKKLKNEENKFRAMAEISPVAVIVVHTPTNRIEYINPMVTQLFGYQLDELGTIEDWQMKAYPDPVYRAELGAFWLGEIAKQLAGDQNKSLKEVEITCKDGSKRQVLSTLGAGEDYIWVFGQDLTEQKRIEYENAVKQKRSQSLLKLTEIDTNSLKTLVDAALNEAISLSGSKIGYFYYYSEETNQFTLHAWSKEVMAECAVISPQTTYDLDKTGFWGEVVRQRKPVVLNDFTTHNPLKKGTPEGHVRLERFMSIPVFSENKIVSVVGVANKVEPYTEIDITELQLLMDSVWKIYEKKELEIALKSSEANLNLLVQSASDFLYELQVTAEYGRVFNPGSGALRVTGYSPAEFENSPDLWEKVIYDLDKSLYSDYLKVVISGEKAGSLTHRIYHKNGSVRWVENTLTINPVVPGGTVLYGMITDVTVKKLAEESAAESGRSYFNLFNSITDGILIVSENGLFYDVNASCEKMFGYSCEELEGKGFSFISEAASGQESAILKLVISTFQTEKVNKFEFWGRNKTGYIFPSEIVFGKGHYFGKDVVIAIIRDITERKAYEEQLISLSLAMEQSPASVIITNLKGEIAYVNRKFTEVTGFSSEEVIGKTASFLKGEATSKGVYTDLWQTILAGKSWAGILQNKKKNGDLFWENVLISPVKGKDGQIVQYLAIKEDITEKLKAEAKLKQQAMFLNGAHDGIILMDLDFRISYANSGFQTIFGWSETDLLGKTPAGLLCPEKEMQEKREKANRMVIQTGNWQGLLSHRNRTGKEIITDTRLTLIHDSAGNPTGIFEISSDITEKHLLEKQFLRAQRLESLGTLASGVAHDLNNVLTPIMMAVEILEKDHSPERIEKIVPAIEKSASRGKNILRQMLTFARGGDEEREIVTPSFLIREIEHLIGETFPRSISIQVKIEPDLGLILSNPTQIHQVLMNLCVNSRDAMPNGGKLFIHARNETVTPETASKILGASPGRYIVISVSDTGCGIPPDLIDKVFEPFFTTKETGKGTGLGLSTVHSIIHSNNGFLTIKSKPSEGTEFNIFLPAVSSGEPQKKQGPAHSVPEGNRETILIVDDEASLRDMARDILEIHNYKVLTAENGNEGLAVFARNQNEIRVVLTDIMMPKMDGKKLIYTIKKLSPATRIIAISGLIEEKEIERDTSFSADEFISKPFSMDTLLDKISAVLKN